ncbi:MAG: acyl-CoA dehydrogenase [SAR86 cluster bacterium]|uniref:Acyl-CoA dehydrogenase n=1 Tax=SAR86 cluster bacterium TaxID=2030880 RepID=A0A2A4MTU4_9GAMM|nr:MAG: acyl-CoA dehydrogenase [SAR86 cluster bacterium]
MSIDTHSLQQWLGKTKLSSDLLTTAPAQALAQTLDAVDVDFQAGSLLPHLWHWVYLLEPVATAELSADGHPPKGDFLPPIELPRRMWAGSRFEFNRQLIIGQEIQRKSTIKHIVHKQGRSGELIIVTVVHEISDPQGIAFTEEQDIVYRQGASSVTSTPITTPEQNSTTNPVSQITTCEADHFKTITPDPVLLFRYSALTFNSHRIHYDLDYTRQVEAYPGLVVHGPLLASLLIGLFQESFPDSPIASFSFKALRPVFHLHSFTVCTNKADAKGVARLWIQDHQGIECMQAQLGLKSNDRSGES